MTPASDIVQQFQAISLYADARAFEQLFRQQFDRLYRFAVQYVQSPEAAEEVVNDVFVKLWKYRATLHTITHPESYLFIAVKNQSLNYIKQYSHLHISLAGDTQGSTLVSGHNPQQDMEWKELYFKLTVAVDDLPEQCRKIFKLVKEEGLKPRRVAQILNISIRTVETQLYRAMKRLDTVLLSQQQKRAKKSGWKDKDNLITILLLIGIAFWY